MFLCRLSQPEKLAFYSLAHAVAAAHTGISVEEQALLDAAVGEMGLSSHPHPQKMSDACSEVSNTEARRIILLELLMIAMIDGDIADAEFDVIREVAELLGIQADLERAKDWATAMLTVYRSGERFIRRAA